MPERVAHLYECQGLSTYRIADAVGLSRQVNRADTPPGRGTHQARGSGRCRPRRGAGADIPDALLADLYLWQRLSCGQISRLALIPARTVHDRLRAQGIRLRTRGKFSRENRLAVEPEILAGMYLRAGLSAGEVGTILGVSRDVVLRAAHDHGFPVRIGGPAPRHGPADIELIDALYADADVQRVMTRHGLRPVPPGGPVWQRFPVSAPITRELATELYVSCGLGLTHIELLTGQPAESVRKLLRRAGVSMRPPGGRSPFLRRWRNRASRSAGRHRAPVPRVPPASR